MMMKRTLIVATTSYAGMGPYVSEIVNTFSPQDDVYFFFHDYEDDFFRKNVKKELHGKSVFYREANSPLVKILNLLTNKSSYDSKILHFCLEKKIEIIHFFNGAPTKSMQCKFKQMGIILLSTVHDLETHEMDKAWYKMYRQRILNERLAENFKVSERIVTNSMEQFVRLKEMYPDKKVFYHSFPSLVTKEIEQGKDIPEEMKKLKKPYILFFGRIEKYKGVDKLYKAFSANSELSKNYTLVIAGKGELGVDGIGGDKNVLFIQRYIMDSELAYLYKNAACVVYPYISATQSGVLSLAYYFGTPVLASDVPFFKNIIASNQAGLLFESGNVQNLGTQLIKILTEDVSSIKDREKEYYRTNYDGAVLKQQLMEIYESQN